jgi:tetratricopeptide (TPR) repeat protein
MLCRLSRRYEEAITYIARAIAIDPNDAKSHANLGQALLILGRYEDSAERFQNALSLDPSLESALVGLQRANGELAATATPETRS